MISIPACGDNQINLMVKRADIDLKYYCAIFAFCMIVTVVPPGLER